MQPLLAHSASAVAVHGSLRCVPWKQELAVVQLEHVPSAVVVQALLMYSLSLHVRQFSHAVDWSTTAEKVDPSKHAAHTALVSAEHEVVAPAPSSHVVQVAHPAVLLMTSE